MSLIAPTPAMRAWRLTDAGVRTALCEAPVGPFPLLEAAYAWHERRPRAFTSTDRYVPVLSADLEGVAPRLARLLTPLAWAIVVSDSETSSPGQGGREWVQVPSSSYHRMGRMLNTVWRERWHPLSGAAARRGAVDPLAGDPKTAALAIWRMAMLLGGYQHHDGSLAVHARTLPGVQTLIRTARRLQVPIVADPGGSRTTVVIRDPARISDLLAAAAR